jgi:hypothetical protein
MAGAVEELTMFGAQLDAARVALEGQAPDGPCGDDCGCVPADQAGTQVPHLVEFARARPASTAGPIGAVVVDQPSAQTLVACTLPAGDQPARLGEWNELLMLAVDRMPVSGGVRLRFPPDPALAGRLGDLAVREQTCCSFFRFTLHLAPDAITVDVLAPEDALPVLSEMFGITLRRPAG